MKLEDVKKLADLARIDMSNEELEGIAKDFDSILAYVGQVQEVPKQGDESSLQDSTNYKLHNVMREDIVTNKEGEYTDKITSESPETENGFIKVKQIL